jgi:hypothetical protein
MWLQLDINTLHSYTTFLFVEGEGPLNHSLTTQPCRLPSLLLNSPFKFLQLGAWDSNARESNGYCTPLDIFPPSSEASRGVYWNQAQNNFTPRILSALECLWLCDSVANKPPIISAACSGIWPKKILGPIGQKSMTQFFFGQCSVGPVPRAKKHQFFQLSRPSHMELSRNLELKLNFEKEK